MDEMCIQKLERQRNRGRGRRQGLPSARFPFHGPLRGASQVIPGKVRVAERREKERKRVKIEYCPAVQA